jgi:LuxR family maltose regulon positive regulatory protein
MHLPFGEAQTGFLVRPRISELLISAMKKPLTIVCAGAGYGKTRAVYDFTQTIPHGSIWMQFSEQDNAGSRFWAKYLQAISGWNKDFAEKCKHHEFPDTPDKLNQHLLSRKAHETNKKFLFVLDDVHLISHPDILYFIERGLSETAKNISVIISCREIPNINLHSLQLRGLIPNITEENLCFTDSELTAYLAEMGITVTEQTRREILKDTGGWAFSVNLIARSLKKSPGYAGYVQNAMKQNIFKLMDNELYRVIPEKLRRFLVRLSLIDHLSAELISKIAQNDTQLLSMMSRQNAYIRYDANIGAYHIHHLFLDFLRERKGILTKDEIYETYSVSAGWCAENGFEIDALRYYEKIGNYEEIVKVLAALPVQMPHDIASYAIEILKNAPPGSEDKIYLFAVMHVRILARLGRWQDAVSQMSAYEKRFLTLPENSAFRNKTLGLIYYNWGNIRALRSALDNCYDFDEYYAKMYNCFIKTPTEADQYADLPVGFWASLVGSPRGGALLRYAEAARITASKVSFCWNGATAGIDLLCRGEIDFYRGNIKGAEPFFESALRLSRSFRQFEIEYKTLFYFLRLHLLRGNLAGAKQTLSEMELRLNEESYSHRFINCDIAFAYFHLALRRPDMIPAWLKENFSPYSHAYFIENSGNQIKARYFYQTGSCAQILGYVEEMKKRESVLYGRIEMLALSSCIFYKQKNIQEAITALKEAYEEAQPNNILMPFIELGKDMRSLTAKLGREADCAIPAGWLDNIRRRASAYAKVQAALCAEYEKTLGCNESGALSARENKILCDLYYGLSRAEIAAKQDISVNTVNAAVNSIYNKLGASNVVDAVRIAAQEKIVRY